MGEDGKVLPPRSALLSPPVAFGPGIARMGFGEYCCLFLHSALMCCRWDSGRCFWLIEGDWKETSLRAEFMVLGGLNAERCEGIEE